jgi:hypothetical protein
MKPVTDLPVWIGLSANWLCIRPIRYNRNAADRNSSTSKPVDTVSIKVGCGNKDKIVLHLVNCTGFSDIPTFPFGSLDRQPVDIVYAAHQL